MKRHAGPIIAAILLLLPVLYVGSYCGLVVPKGFEVITYYRTSDPRYPVIGNVDRAHYRLGSPVAGTIFWPLEQIDRKVRPGAWVKDEFWNTEERSGRAMPLP